MTAGSSRAQQAFGMGAKGVAGAARVGDGGSKGWCWSQKRAGGSS